MSDIAIKIENLSKVYKLYDKPIDRMKEALSLTKKKYSRNHYALNNISFEVKKGETVGIIGSNGSGKSTLLKIITGVLSLSSGNLQVNGKISALLELGAGFNPEYTGIQNVYLNGTMMGYTKEQMDERVKPIMDFADIGEFIYQPVKTYSSGMFARLAFAVAINIEPKILIVDEALSVGDVFFQNKCFKKFDKLQEEGTTILFVSHDIGSIRQMCSRVLWIEKGEQIVFGNKDEVCKKYINKQFKESNQLNEKEVEKEHLKAINIPVKSNIKKLYPKIKVDKNNILSEDIEIISCFVKDKDNNIVTTLEVLNQYSVYIVCKVKAVYMDKIIVGIVLENSKGINLLALNTYINNHEKVLEISQGEVMEVKFDFQLPKILKGQYLISPAIAKGNQKENVILTWLHGALDITILNNGYNTSLMEIDSDVKIEKYSTNNIELY
ncbi:ABC transporter ATP-binding protein [Clostridium aquiflavi]|uniref:ABC transporter ATP-binding protein n=1 Tax=Clostridium aquiflavi TaxID=3073603 RepID=A0ABU1EIN3_9CLOT|nr:ABC transporter ATP-binding protein [Clostridium sp. 5N-1]MDR5588259.1 ABC transporter ATP-binding protein [Clostridium sp. 5N-1]